MSKEQKQIIDEVFGEYSIMVWRITNMPLYGKEEFINKIKTDDEFAKKWGLKIEERELSLEERGEWDSKKDNVRNTWGQVIQTFTPKEVRTWLNEKNVPTKIITVTYNNETIESYEG